MTDNLRHVSLAEVAVIIGAIGAVIALLRKVLPALRKAMRLIDDVVGVEESAPGRSDGRPGVMDRIASLEAKVSHIADTTAATVVQVHPNGGSSMRDQIDAMAESQAELKRMLEERLPRSSDEDLNNP